MKPVGFTDKKFLSLSYRAQHKSCADILFSSLKGDITFSRYSQLSKLLNLKEITSFEEKCDRYHYHLVESNTHIKEHDFIHNIAKEDEPSSIAPLTYVFYLDGLRSAFNIGNIIRTIEAFRIGSVCISGNITERSRHQIEKAAMGTYEIVSHHDINLLPRPFIGLETVPDSLPIHSLDLPETATFVIGNEEFGISNEMLKKIDIFTHIPLFGYKNSINVSSAFSIAAHHISHKHSIT